MPLEYDGNEFLEFKGSYLQKAFASKIKRQIPYTKVTKFLPLTLLGVGFLTYGMVGGGGAESARIQNKAPKVN